MLLTAAALGAAIAGMLLYNRNLRSRRRDDSSHQLNYPGSGSGQQKKPLMS